jgi:hypothetical protein
MLLLLTCACVVLHTCEAVQADGELAATPVSPPVVLAGIGTAGAGAQGSHICLIIRTPVHTPQRMHTSKQG